MTTQLERVDAPPREELLRMAPFALRAADDDSGGDGLTLDGWAAVFNRETVIDSWEGRFREFIAPGAMKKSFRERTPRVQFDHGHHPLIGSIPIGQVESVREDIDPELAPEGGAHVIARLHDNWLIEPVRDAIASRSIDGMSFRFTVVREAWSDPDGKPVRDMNDLRRMLRETLEAPEDELLLRALKELKVPELGPVVWQAYDDTSVAVRSKVTIDLGHIHDDPAQRRMLAEALYVADAAERAQETSDAPLDPEHPSAEEPSEDAPLRDEHPSDDNDAPPSDGHPSAPTPAVRDLRDEIQQWVEFSKGHLASITKAKES